MPVDAAHSDPKPELLAWLYLVVQHPACDASTAETAQAMIAQVTSALLGHLVAAAGVRSQNGIESVVAGLLAATSTGA